MSNLGGKRAGAGRKPGGKNLRTLAATELVKEAQDRFPGYNAIAALIALAMAAEKSGDVETARQCHAAVLPYTAPRFKPVEVDPDAVVELEGRLHRARLDAAAAFAKDDPATASLAERLLRAKDRLESGLSPVVVITPPQPAIAPPPQDRERPAAPPLPAERVVAPTINAPGDWQPPAQPAPYISPIWPEEAGSAATEYDNFSERINAYRNP